MQGVRLRNSITANPHHLLGKKEGRESYLILRLVGTSQESATDRQLCYPIILPHLHKLWYAKFYRIYCECNRSIAVSKPSSTLSLILVIPLSVTREYNDRLIECALFLLITYAPYAALQKW